MSDLLAARALPAVIVTILIGLLTASFLHAEPYYQTYGMRRYLTCAI